MGHLLDNKMTPKNQEMSRQKFEKPMVCNFMITFLAPESEDTLLDREGNTVMTCYQDVDWKGMANILQARINGHVPKNVKVYVANDGPDLFDIINHNDDNPNERVTDEDFGTRTIEALDQVGIKDYRGGILKLYNKTGLHLNREIDGERLPLTGLVFGIKFSKSMQLMDYLPSTLGRLFGVYYGMPSKKLVMLRDVRNPLTLAPEIHAWIEEQFGVFYSNKCCLMFLGTTLSEA